MTIRPLKFIVILVVLATLYAILNSMLGSFLTPSPPPPFETLSDKQAVEVGPADPSLHSKVEPEVKRAELRDAGIEVSGLSDTEIESLYRRVSSHGRSVSVRLWMSGLLSLVIVCSLLWPFLPSVGRPASHGFPLLIPYLNVAMALMILWRLASREPYWLAPAIGKHA